MLPNHSLRRTFEQTSHDSEMNLQVADTSIGQNERALVPNKQLHPGLICIQYELADKSIFLAKWPYLLPADNSNEYQFDNLDSCTVIGNFDFFDILIFFAYFPLVVFRSFFRKQYEYYRIVQIYLWIMRV